MPVRERPSGAAHFEGGGREVAPVPVSEGAFWTARQRDAHSLHEVSYRACFKPQLPRFFVSRFAPEGGRVYDPFSGRGTTLLEAALLGRVPCGCDANPIAPLLLLPRLHPPAPEEIDRALAEVDWSQDPPWSEEEPPREDLLVFFHPETLRELRALRDHLSRRQGRAERWIRMVAITRLTGHSTGFFSVYTLPPNQAVTARSQRRINARRDQIPPRRVVGDLIRRKSRALLKDLDGPTRDRLARAAKEIQFVTGDARATRAIRAASVDLVVTSPPFLDVVDYAADNWMRCWFAGIRLDRAKITTSRGLPAWREAMTEVFRELRRVVRPGGRVAFEVGEVRSGKIGLEEAAIEAGRTAGLRPERLFVHRQNFTKTAHCWGVKNNEKGTNSHRIAVFLRGD